MLSFSTGRASLVQITALRLEALQLADQGLYDCRILLLDEPTDELQNGTWTELSVTGELCGLVFVCVCWQASVLSVSFHFVLIFFCIHVYLCVFVGLIRCMAEGESFFIRQNQ